MDEQEVVNEETEEQKDSKNGTAKGLKVIGVLTIIAGIIGALTLSGEASSGYGDPDVYLQSLAVGSLVSGILTGSLFIGISEIIDQLFQLNKT